jgi:hypothetical protein
MRTMIAASFVLTLSVSICPVLAGPVTVTIEPVSQTLNVGGTADVIVGISGLGDMAPPALAAFTIGLAFDPAILSLNNVTFGDQGAGIDYLAPSGPAGSLTAFGPTGPGILALSEVSLEPGAVLLGAQPEAFVLATVTFDAVGPGTSPVIYGAVLLVDELGNPLWPDPVFNSASITVQAIPAPGAMALTLVGLGLTARLRRRHTP